jgi:hypothetical protein
LSFEIRDFGVSKTVSEGWVWVNFLLALGYRVWRGCWEWLLVRVRVELFVVAAAAKKVNTYMRPPRCPAGRVLASS